MIWKLPKSLLEDMAQNMTNVRYSRYPGIDNYHVIIENVTLSHSGNFSCNGINEELIGFVQSSNLIVTGKIARLNFLCLVYSHVFE